MADIYDRSKALAVRMLAPRDKGGKGAVLSLIRTVKGPRNPDTGASSEVVTTYSGSGLRETYQQRDIDGSKIKMGDVKLLVSPMLVSGQDMPLPSTQDKFSFDGTVYTVVSVNPWNYVGLSIGYEIQARV